MGVCCYSFLKYMVMIFDLLYMLLGGTLLGTSLWLYLDASEVSSVTEDIEVYNYGLYFLMAVGTVMFVMGLLGCCGAFQESQCMLATFFALVFVLFVGQIAAGIWLKSTEERFIELAEQSFTKAIQQDYGESKLKSQAFDVIQRELKCCGSEKHSDWADSRFNTGKKSPSPDIGIAGNGSRLTYKVPKSCCVVDDGVPACTEPPVITLMGPAIEIYNDGCAKKMVKLMEEHIYEVFGVVAAILLIEILAMVFSMILCCTVRRIDHVKA